MASLPTADSFESMKRAQLVKLCKQRGIKATGKNTELIDKLRLHSATTLSALAGDVEMDAQPVAPEDVDMDDDGLLSPAARQLQTDWEVVDGASPSIPRAQTLDGLSGLLKGSKPAEPLPKSSSLSMGLKNLVSNIKRVGSSRSDLAAIDDFRPPALGRMQSRETIASKRSGSKGSDAVSMMQMDELGPTPATPGLTLSQLTASRAQEPLDLPPPLGTQDHSPAASTVRLVTSTSVRQESPTLPGGKMSSKLLSELFPPLPEGLEAAAHLASPGGLYPRLPSTTLGAPFALEPSHQDQPEPALPGSFPPAERNPITPPPSLPTPQQTTPFQFVFGSPQRGVSQRDFTKVTRGILEELDRRVVAAGGKGGVPVARFNFGEHDEEAEKGAGAGGKGKGSRFDREHERGFAKMDSIANHYAARRPESRTGQASTSAAGAGGAGGQFQARANKRKTVDVSHPRGGSSRATTAFVAAVTGGQAPPSAEEKEEEDEGLRRGGKRARISSAQTGKIHPSASTSASALNSASATGGGEGKGKKPLVQVRDTPAQRRKLDTTAARRRSSLAGRRASPGGTAARGMRNVSYRSATASSSNAAAASTTSSTTAAAPKGAPGGKQGFFGRAAKTVKSVFSSASGPGATRPMPVPPAPASLNQMPEIRPISTPALGEKNVQKAMGKGRVAAGQSGGVHFAPPQPRAQPQPSAAVGGAKKTAAYNALSAAPNRPVTGRVPSTGPAQTRATSRSTTAGGASGTHRVPSMPQRNAIPTFLESEKKGEKENAPLTPALGASLGGSLANGMKDMNALDQANALQNTSKKKQSTLYAPTASSLARAQATVRPLQANNLNILSSPLQAVQETRGIFSPVAPSGNPLDTPLNLKPKKRLVPATAPVPRSRSALRFSSPVKPMSPTRLRVSPSKTPSKAGMRRRPRISRGVVLNKLNERRQAAAAVAATSSSTPKRSSLAAKAYNRRSLGAKAAAGLSRPSGVMDLQRRAKMSEIAQRRSMRAELKAGGMSPAKSSPSKQIGIAL